MRRNVLLIDDDPDVRLILSCRLRQAGCEVITASNGLEGLAMLRRQRPWCVLVDLMMPVMDGFTFLEALQSEPSPPPPVVVVSQLDEPVTAARVRRLGALELFSKGAALDRGFATGLEHLVASAQYRDLSATSSRTVSAAA